MAADEEGIFKCTIKDATSDVYVSAALDRCPWQQNLSLVTGQYSDLKVCYLAWPVPLAVFVFLEPSPETGVGAIMGARSSCESVILPQPLS